VTRRRWTGQPAGLAPGRDVDVSLVLAPLAAGQLPVQPAPLAGHGLVLPLVPIWVPPVEPVEPVEPEEWVCFTFCGQDGDRKIVGTVCRRVAGGVQNDFESYAWLESDWDAAWSPPDLTIEATYFYDGGEQVFSHQHDIDFAAGSGYPALFMLGEQIVYLTFVVSSDPQYGVNPPGPNPQLLPDVEGFFVSWWAGPTDLSESEAVDYEFDFYVF